MDYKINWTKNMRIQIVGSKGQLGSTLVRELEDYGLITPSREELDIADVRKTTKFIHEVDPEIVISTAAYHDTDKTEKYPKKTFEVNTWATRNLAENCRDIGARLIWISSNYVFGAHSSRAPYSEDDIPSPVGYYGLSKLAGEKMIKGEMDAYHIIRTGGLFGENGQKSFPQTILELSNQLDEVKVKDDEFSSVTFAPDLAHAIHKIALLGNYGTFHLFNQGQPSWYEVADELVDNVVPVSRENEMFEDEPIRPQNSLLTTLREEFKLRPWQDALQEFYEEVT